jgi:hypothetical protein
VFSGDGVVKRRRPLAGGAGLCWSRRRVVALEALDLSSEREPERA